jgi:Replication-relaxation
MSHRPLRARGLDVLRDQLSGRDVAIVGQIAELRLMSGRQIEAIHFPAADHDNADAAARACRRSLDRLARERLLVRLERRIGGARAGSGSFVYALGPVGHRLLALSRPRPRYREPTATFTDHTLAITQLVVDVTDAMRRNRFDLLVCQAEPRCWRRFATMGAPSVLRPDLFLTLGVGEFEHRWFCEVDRGTEHLPAVLRKCRVYDAYYASGTEQSAHGVFPRVCWLVPDDTRARRLRDAIAADRRLTDALFVVTTLDRALDVLARGTP